MAPDKVDVIIIGAGIVGLTLAHALRKNQVSYLIVERDGSIDQRPGGWSITLQWAKPELKQCIPKQIFDNLDSIIVDHDFYKNHAEFSKYLNLENLDQRYLIPTYPDATRVRREGLRQLLAKDLNIRWGSKIEAIDLESDKRGVRVTLQNGLAVQGKLVVGCEGTNSWTRRFLCPDTWELQPLPILFIGLVVSLSATQAEPMLKIDPVTFQGCHPKSGVQLFWSIVSTPETNRSVGTANPYFKAQCCVSWKPIYVAEQVPLTSAGRIQRLRELCSTMAEPIRNMLNDIPEDSEAIEIKLQDWPCLDWSNHNGRVTLAGDAAHAMTMYRGEAANYGIMDAARVAEKIIAVTRDGLSQSQAISEYEEDLRDRSRRGVLMNRQACMDAHDLKAIRDDSPLLAQRNVHPFARE